MILDVSELDGRVLRVDRRLDASAFADLGAGVAVREARLSGEAQEGPRGVEFRGRLEGIVELECGRCLEPCTAELATGFRLLVVPAEPVESGETELEDDDLDLYEAPDGKVDLAAVAREQAILNLPLKPVCSPGCRGLCPTCGGNRNRIECGCSTAEPDPRLAPLEALKKRLGRS